MGNSLYTLADTLPGDSGMKMGKLEDGLSYYICKNAQPKGVIEFIFVVRAGTYVESKCQQELAHLVEHMAFEGTKNFPGDSIRRYLAQHGVAFGANLNAYTSGYHTGYTFSIPSGDSILLNNSLRIIKDWSQDMSFPHESVRSQGGAVAGELRLKGEGYRNRIFYERNSAIFRNLKYGTGYYLASKEKVVRYNQDDVRGFYNKWYKPNLQAVIVVGDVDTHSIETQLRVLFSDSNDKRNASRSMRRVTAWRGKLVGKNSIIKIKHPEVTEVEMELFLKKRTSNNLLKTVMDYRLYLIDRLCDKILAGRIEKVNSPDNENFVYGHIVNDIYGSQLDVATLHARLWSVDEITHVYHDMLVELVRIQRLGISSVELEDAKTHVWNDHNGSYLERSDYIAGRCRDNFVFGKSLHSSAVERDMISSVLADIELEETNNRLKFWVDFDHDMDVVLITSDTDFNRLPKRDQFRQIEKDVWNREVMPLSSGKSDFSDNSLSDFFDFPAQVDSLCDGVTWTGDEVRGLNLSNGIEVVIIPSDYDDLNRSGDQIKLVGLLSGGAHLLEPSMRFAADDVAEIVYNAGLGDLNKHELDELFSKNGVYVNPFADEVSAQLNGSCSSENLESMLQLMYLYLTVADVDSAVLDRWKLQKRNEAVKQGVSSDVAFDIHVQALLHNGSNAVSESEIEKLSTHIVSRIYQELFLSSHKPVFFLIGDLKVDMSLKEMICRYLGGLPNKKNQIPFSGRERFDASGPIYDVFRAGSADRANIRMYFPGEKLVYYDMKSDLTRQILTRMFDMRVQNLLRSREGATYFAGVFDNVSFVAEDSVSFRLGVGFDCEVSEWNRLTSLVKEEFYNTLKGEDVESLFLRAVESVSERCKSSSLTIDQLRWMYSSKKFFSKNIMLQLLRDISLSDVRSLFSSMGGGVVQTCVHVPLQSQ